ncbi:MAG TPA: FAD-binding protein [Miltoncostaeaceae bacterium]|nr:FAD-binding protein [Miltoncostaeaceae bacterium]
MTDSATAGRAGIEVVTPADPGWDEARRAWNLAVDQRPDVVVLPTSAEQVAAAVRRAREAGLRVAAQGTGHGASPRGSLEGAMLINMARMRDVVIDAEGRSARAAAGARWEDVVAPAAEHGLDD